MPIKIAIPAAILFVLVILVIFCLTVLAPVITPVAPIYTPQPPTVCPVWQQTADAAWYGVKASVCR